MNNIFDGFGPVYILNLKSQIERRKYMEDQFAEHGISNYKFLEGIDGRTEDLSKYVHNPEEIKLQNTQIAVTAGHLFGIQKWLKESDSEYAIFMEDDLSFETVQYWSWTWKEFLSKVNTYFNILQLAIINPRSVNPSMHYREVEDWSAACYLITRDWAKQLVSTYIIDGKMKLPAKPEERIVSEGLLFSGCACLSFPLFVFETNFESSINKSHVEIFHERSKKEALDFWKTNPKDIFMKLGE